MTGPIRNKLLLGLSVLLVMLGALAISGNWSVYAYRGLVKDLRGRAAELPIASQLARQISDLRVQLAEMPEPIWNADSTLELVQGSWQSAQFEQQLLGAMQTLNAYRAELADQDQADQAGLTNQETEQALAQQIAAGLQTIHERIQHPNWNKQQTFKIELSSQLNQLHELSGKLPSHLYQQLGTLANTVRSEYHTMLALNWLAGGSAIALLGAFLYLNYRWIFRPLSVLVAGSRRVAAGDFSYRIELKSRDEMAELGEALNQMTTRFQQIRDDLDRQVQERTKQVVRSEQLASVGFLAAGVAHEINNPLASIAMCAESLEGRLHDLQQDLQSGDEPSEAAQQTMQIATHYLSMIQNEAFRCKEITEKLLDFSRLGNARREITDLRILIEQVVEMVRHLGKYQDRQIVIVPARSGAEPVLADVVATEIKQVVLTWSPMLWIAWSRKEHFGFRSPPTLALRN